MKKVEVEKRIDEYFKNKAGEEIYRLWMGSMAYSLIGITFDKAKRILMESADYRVVSVDGEPRVVTCDFKPDRMNISIENGIITKVEFG